MPPNLLLITIDCLRPDHVGWHGSVRPTTPFMDTLASSSVIFENAIVAGLPTYFSFPALLAGRFPLAYGRDFVGLLPGEPTLATTLRDAGYATAGFIAGNPYISRWAGYAQGFDTFQDGLESSGVADAPEPQEPANQWQTRARRAAAHIPGGNAAYTELYFRYGLAVRARAYRERGWDSWRAYPSAATLTASALEWLGQNTQRPFFLWLHYMDAHRPYHPSTESLRALGIKGLGAEPSQRAFEHYNYWIRSDYSAAQRARRLDIELALYDASIRDIDRQVQRLVTTLRMQTPADSTAITLTADHGEAFLERGESDHDPITLHRTLTHVPLLLCAPTLPPHREKSIFSQIDLAPTLLDVLAIPHPATFVGSSRAVALSAGSTWESIALTEVIGGRTRDHMLGGRALRSGMRLLSAQAARTKLVLNFASAHTEMYNLQTDPLEEHALAPDAAPAQAAPLWRAMRAHLQRQQAQPYTRAQLDLRLDHLRGELTHPAVAQFQAAPTGASELSSD